MDRKTSSVLSKINRSVSMKGLMKSVDIFEQDRKTLKRMLNHPNVPQVKKEIIRVLLENNLMYRKQEVLNEERAREIERRVEHEVKKAIKKGIIPPPKADAWMRRHGLA